MASSSNATLPNHVLSLREKLENVLVTSFVTLCALLLAGHYMRRKFLWLRALHLPASLIGGLLGWVLFAFNELCGFDELAEAWLSAGWGKLPGFCTNIIFCCLFLGTPVPAANEVLQSPRREHLIYGLTIVFGQYIVSALVTSCCRLFDPTLSPVFSTVMPYGYAGGPVVAEAMRPLYAPDSFDYPEGYPLALLAAAVGMFAGVIVGAVLVNLAPIAQKSHARTPLADANSPCMSPDASRRASCAHGACAAHVSDAAAATPPSAASPPPAAAATQAMGGGGSSSSGSSAGGNGDQAAAAAAAVAAAAAEQAPRVERHSSRRLSDALAASFENVLGDAATLRHRRQMGRIARALYDLRRTASASDHYPPHRRPRSGEQTVSSESLDSLMFHVCLVAAVMLAGYVLRVPFVLVEQVPPMPVATADCHRLPLMVVDDCFVLILALAPRPRPRLRQHPTPTQPSRSLPSAQAFPVASFVGRSHLLSVRSPPPPRGRASASRAAL